jgi:UDPglucose 6-dehydrogenase
MKIGIIGLGVIGNACKYGFEKLGYKIFVHDIKLNTNIEDVINTDITFICVPTPQNENGSCDLSIVESVISELKLMDYNGIIAIKSTVIPTTTEIFLKKYKMKICFVPEFLRERCAISDFIENHDILAIGTNDDDIFEIVKKCHGSYPKNIIKMKPTEAELLKYYSNVFNAMKITFANEMYEICKSVNADYTKIKDAFIKRGTTKDMYLDVNENFRGYGGVCLPKDTAALAFFVKELNLDMKLFETIDNENKKFKTTVFNGMRK